MLTKKNKKKLPSTNLHGLLRRLSAAALLIMQNNNSKFHCIINIVKHT